MKYKINISNYTSNDILKKEIQHVFQARWLLVDHINSFRGNISCKVYQVLGRSIIICKSENNNVYAFYNSCPHRGHRLLAKACNTNLKKIECEYHKWAFNLEGNIHSIPYRSLCGFTKHQELAKIHISLIKGFIFINFALKPPKQNFSKSKEALGLLELYQCDSMYSKHETQFSVNCNWKAFLDNALEPYHFLAVHKNSIASFTDPAKLKFILQGENQILSLEIANYKWRLWLDKYIIKGSKISDGYMSSIIKVFIFPNTIINLLPTSMTVFTVWPESVSTCKIIYNFYDLKPINIFATLKNRLTYFLSKWLLKDDLKLLAEYQGGLESAPFKFMQLGNLEISLNHYHKSIEKAIR